LRYAVWPFFKNTANAVQVLGGWLVFSGLCFVIAHSFMVAGSLRIAVFFWGLAFTDQSGRRPACGWAVVAVYGYGMRSILAVDGFIGR